jgi:hypothetical protein
VHSGKLGPGGARLNIDLQADGWHWRGDSNSIPLGFLAHPELSAISSWTREGS